MTGTIPANLDELVTSFLSPLAGEVPREAALTDVLAAATRRRPQLLLVLDTIVVQVSVAVFGLDVDYARKAYKPLQRKLEDKRWQRKAPREAIDLGKAVSRLLNSWLDLVATGYSAPAALGKDLMCDLIPDTLKRLTRYATAVKDTPLSEAATRAEAKWAEVFHAR